MKVELAPSQQLLVGAEQAAQLCGVSKNTWLAWDASGLYPRRIQMGGRTLWSVAQLRRWSAACCPSRETFETMQSHNV